MLGATVYRLFPSRTPCGAGAMLMLVSVGGSEVSDGLIPCPFIAFIGIAIVISTIMGTAMVIDPSVLVMLFIEVGICGGPLNADDGTTAV